MTLVPFSIYNKVRKKLWRKELMILCPLSLADRGYRLFISPAKVQIEWPDIPISMFQSSKQIDLVYN